MRLKTFAWIAAIAGVAVVGTAFMAAPARAQRDPAYQAARAAGSVGEKPDGYLGVVGNAPASVQAMVDDINLRRRAAYTERARAAGSTVEQFAFTTGCNLIAQTVAGEKYMAPDGRWLTRTADDPVRDSRCI
jgi:uncharacterized protein